jgi:tRNA-Thr(GGU) m(6)t(6)A37 methyltransferase TsaA
LDEFSPIGVIRTPFASKDGCPIQPAYAQDAEGTVTVFDEYEAGLKDIEAFSHIYLLYAFDRAGEVELVRPTFLDDEEHGVFASRHPCRPNGIGLSVVRLVRRDGNTLAVAGVDMLDRTPLLDIKPYVARFDRIDDASDGWVADRPWRKKPLGRE